MGRQPEFVDPKILAQSDGRQGMDVVWAVEIFDI